MRPVRADDAACLFRIYGDPATNTFNPAGPYPDIAFAKTRLAQWLEGWQQHGFGQMAIYGRLEPQEIIGFGGISVRPLEDGVTWNLGYRFATKTWGKGLATEFCQRMLDYAFDERQLQKVTAIVRPDHLASQRVLLKSGLALRGQIADVTQGMPSLFYVLKVEEWHRHRREMVRQPFPD